MKTNYKFIKDGEEIIVSSTIPGVTIVPHGLKIEQGEIISEDEAQSKLKQIRKDNKNYIDPKSLELEQLKAKVDELQQNQSKEPK